MYTLFDSPNPKQAPRWFFQGFETVRRRWDENLDRLSSYWASSGYAVDSQHILSRLVGSFSIPLYDNVRKYSDRIEDLVPQLCMAVGIVSPTNGRIPQNDPGWFYGAKGQEFLISADFGYRPEAIAKNWRKFEVIRVIRHPFINLEMGLPDGKRGSDDFSVIELDIPALAVQYWCWSKEQLALPLENRERIQQFIGQYVLPQMLRSQTTVAWFNRILAMWNGELFSSSAKQTPIAIPTNYTNVDAVCKQIVTILKNNRLSYTELMATIPTAKKESMLAFLQTPYGLIHRQNQWAMELAYIPYASLAVSADMFHEGTQNQVERNAIRRLVKRITTDRLFDAAPRSMRESIVMDFLVRVGNYV